MSGSPYNPAPTIAAQVNPTPYQQVAPTADDFGGGIARAVEGFGETVQDVGDEQQKIEMMLAAQRNETLVLDAANKGSLALGELEAEFRQLHGNNAVEKLPEYQKRVREVGEGISKTLPNTVALAEFNKRFSGYITSTEKGFGLHAADESDRAYVNALQGSVAAAQSRIVRNAGLGSAAPDYDELIDSVAALGTKLGWDKGQADAYLQGQTSAAVGDLVEARIARGQLGAAQRIFKEAVEANVPGTDVPFLDANHQARISHTIAAEIKTQTAMARAEASQDAQDLAQSDIQSRLVTGKPLPTEAQNRIKAGMTPKQWDAYQSNAERADTIFKATGDMRTTPTAELATIVERLKPQGGEIDFEQRNAAYTRAASLAQSVAAQRKADAGASVREAFPSTVGAAWQAYEAEQTPANLQAAVKASLTAQKTLGIAKPMPVPNSFAYSVAGSINAAPPAEAHKQMRFWADQFGPNWNATFRQMSRILQPELKVSAIMPDQASAALMIETSRVEPAKIDKALGIPSSGANSLAYKISTDPTMIDFRASLSQRLNGQGTANDVSQSATTLARGLMATRSMAPDEAIKTAVQRVIEDKYDIGRVNDRPFHVQKGLPVGSIEEGATVVQRKFPVGVLDLPRDIPKGMTKADADAQWARSVQTNGYWATNDDVTGLILYSERGIPVRINGQEVSRTWEQLQEAGVSRDRSATEKVLESRDLGVN